MIWDPPFGSVRAIGPGGTLHEVEKEEMGVPVVFCQPAFVIHPVPKAGLVSALVVAGISMGAAVL
jgi:hypothetical protein